MLDKKTIIITILIGIIFLGSGVYAYNEIKEKSYQQGFNDGLQSFYQQILISLSQDGSVSIPININNETIPIKLIIENN